MSAGLLRWLGRGGIKSLAALKMDTALFRTRRKNSRLKLIKFNQYLGQPGKWPRLAAERSDCSQLPTVQLTLAQQSVKNQKEK